MIKVGLVDCNGPLMMEEFLHPKLLQKGYDVEFARHLYGLKEPESLDAILIHPGVNNQLTAIEFGLLHPEIKTAIVTETEEDYYDDIPMFSYKSDKIIPFIEGKP